MQLSSCSSAVGIAAKFGRVWAYAAGPAGAPAVWRNERVALAGLACAWYCPLVLVRAALAGRREAATDSTVGEYQGRLPAPPVFVMAGEGARARESK